MIFGEGAITLDNGSKERERLRDVMDRIKAYDDKEIDLSQLRS